MGRFEPCLYFLLEVNALRYTSAGQAGMVCALLPLMVALVAFVLLGERVSRRQLLGFAIAIVGIALLGLGRAQTSSPQRPARQQPGDGRHALRRHLFRGIQEALQPLRRDDTDSVAGLRRHALLRALCLQCALARELGLAGHGVILFLGAFVTLGAYLLYNWSVTQVKVTLAAAYVTSYRSLPCCSPICCWERRSLPCNGWPVPPCWPASGWANCRPAGSVRRQSPPGMSRRHWATVWVGKHAV